MLVLEKYEPKLSFYIKIGLLQSLENKLSSRRLGKQREILKLLVFPIDIKTLLMILLIAQMQSPWIGQDQ